MADMDGATGDTAGRWAWRCDGWTPEKREAFFDLLMTSCNVTKSCAAVGMSTRGAYQLRRRDPAFAAQWDAALQAGYDRIELSLIDLASKALIAQKAGDAAGTAVDPTLAITLLKMRDARRTEPRGRAGPKVRRATQAETDATILKQLAALARRASQEQA